MKKCSVKKCSRPNDTAFKQCEFCRKSRSEWKKKRKREAKDIKVPKGSRLCKNCSHIKPESDFKSTVHRRTKLTTRCRSCRDSLAKSQKNPTTTTGKCRALWLLWRKMQECKECRCKVYEVMQADHLGNKVHALSDYCHWSCHGGVEAMKKELKICQPLCISCHRMVTKKRKEEKRQAPRVIRRRAMIDQKKLEIGACNNKACKKRVTLDRACTFDFDHLEPEKLSIHISNIVYYNKKKFQHFFQTEIPKCQLLCCVCHHLKTNYELKINPKN